MLGPRVFLVIALLSCFVSTVGAQEQTTTDLLWKTLKELGILVEQNRKIVERLEQLENEVANIHRTSIGQVKGLVIVDGPTKQIYDSGGKKRSTAICPPGKVVVGGGFDTSGPTKNLILLFSLPIKKNQWQVEMRREPALGSGGGGKFFARAVCVDGK